MYELKYSENFYLNWNSLIFLVYKHLHLKFKSSAFGISLCRWIWKKPAIKHYFYVYFLFLNVFISTWRKGKFVKLLFTNFGIKYILIIMYNLISLKWKFQHYSTQIVAKSLESSKVYYNHYHLSLTILLKPIKHGKGL